ncbi:pilus assembly protein [Pseudoduganella lutea]|uniref:Pilus assembly protein PilY n=1 Tax=Pseudoduganella lutea TaxID=321985 RepID=A0A4P6KTF8_9BURK|nr:PilC/PilY family type IV pilus protein [Pseudoduganella lutea]QBE62391.1 pilus assembly protein PilY [Pseudoduganella lutea]
MDTSGNVQDPSCRPRGSSAACISPLLALALGLCGAMGLPEAATEPPWVAIDDGNAALACSVAGGAGGTVQGAVLAIPAAQLPPGGSDADAAVFRVAYDLAAGSGTLTRASLARNGDGTSRLTAPLWDAAAVLAAMPPAARRLFTMDDAGLTTPFEWPRLSPAQQAALDRPPGGTAGDGRGADRVAWLRGDRTLEGSFFRRRAGLLGDAVHGMPLYLGGGLNLHGDAAHAAFQARTLQRTPAIYLGANDGMLHAFDAGTGTELFAYLPAMLLPALSELPAPGYTHRPYVDGPLASGEALIGGAWRSVLVGTPGAGAQGLFALDVTDPAAFDAGLGALWEFTARDDAALGNVMQPAQVARLKVRNRAGVPEYRHFAIAGNGLNGHAANRGQGGQGGGALFLLALDKPPAERWRLDTNYYRLDTPPGDPALPSGLGGAALVNDDDKVLRHVYAGDLQGRLWRFDFSRNAPWRSNPAWRPVFVARDAAGRPQPITQPPKVVHAEGGGYLVLFGTGSLYGRTEREAANFTPQSFYAIHDHPGPELPATPLERADLLQRHVEGAAEDAGFTVSGRLASFGAAGRPKGWYLDFAHGP